MSLTQCKECKKEISKKAEKCPHCGAPVKKKTSIFTWLVLLIIVYFVYSAGNSPSTNHEPNNKTNTASQPKAEIKSEPKDTTSWIFTSNKDEMTGEASEYMISERVHPIRKMDFPYHDVKASLVVACDSKGEWAYFAFNKAPNLANDETKDGYNLIKTRIKWDDTLEETNLTQKWQSKFVQFADSNTAVSNIIKFSNTRLELQWHGERPTYFDFSLKDSSASIQNIRNKCSKL